MPPNQVLMKPVLNEARSCPVAVVVSMKMTDSPAAMLVMPLSDTALPKELELSSIFQPVMSMALEPELVTSNQSARKGLLPLDQGATSEM